MEPTPPDRSQLPPAEAAQRDGSQTPLPGFDRGAAGLVLAAAALFLAGLGATDLWAPDEPRYAAIAEELRSMAHGLRGLVLLHANGEAYTQKPPLYFWLAALAGAPFGRVTEFAARLPSALASVGSVALVVLLGRRLFGPTRVPLLAAGLLATSYRFLFVARRAQLDGLLCLLLLLALTLFATTRGGLHPAESEPGRSTALDGRRVAAVHAALGLGALCKGPVAWLPLVSLAGFLLWEGRRPDLARWFRLPALTLSIGPLLLWAAAAVSLGPEGYAEEAIGRNVFGRFFGGTAHVRPFYYYLYQLPVDFLPWSLPLPLAAVSLAKGLRAEEALRTPTRFLACWIAVPLAFFTISAGKRGLYLLPIFPALALATAAGLADWANISRARRRALPRMIGLVGALQAVFLLVVAPLALDPEKSPRPLAEAAAAQIRPGQPLGLLGLEPLEAAIPYYGGPASQRLSNETDLSAFLARPGALVLMRRRDFEARAEALRLEALADFREGRRQLTLVRKTAPKNSPQGQDEA